MLETNSTPKRSFRPRVKSKNKSYAIKDCALYNIRTKNRLEDRLQKPLKELGNLASDNNYRIFYLKKNGTKPREIQAPTFGLDVVQARIASLLVRVTLPDHVHSGRKGRSYITNARAHLGDHPVLTMDIQKFYPSVTKKSIYHFFLSTMNAAPDVAGILAELCSYQDHIPTGSRLSMLLSYWANHSIFSQLNSLCASRDIVMTTYVDDLTFSGKAVNNLLEKNVTQIVENGGLTIHPRKTRLYRREQKKLITGVVIDKFDVRVKNEHHKNIYTLFSELDHATDDAMLLELQNKLIGRLNAAGQVDPKFKQRAKNLVSAI